MKSPWKFLSQLTSRRRPAETQERSVADDTDTEVSEGGARQTSALPSEPRETSNNPDQDENPTSDFAATATSIETDSDLDLPQAVLPPVDGEEVRVPAGDEVTRSGPDAHVLAPQGETSKRARRTPRPKRLGRAKRTRTDTVSQSTSVENSDQSAQSSRESFFDEVASLDEEIMQLRSQLAQRLQMQNVQLTKMLERFGGS